MKQVAQLPRDGRISVVDAPLPVVRPGWLLVANRYSLISAGTERSKIELGDKNLLQKARARPDLARKVIDKSRTEGVKAAFESVRERLGALAPLGYSSAGTVIRVGEGVEGFSPGDRVACAGAGYANHAEVVACPKHLVAKVGEATPLESACYATVGAIALHGVRQSEVTLGERVGVIGLGLVGQLALRILQAAGCQGIGIDTDAAAVALAVSSGARAFERGAPGLEEAVRELTGGMGLDAVLICAATRSTDPVELASRLARDRGRLVVVGDVTVSADRATMYEKELELRLSRSYGPGRYDRDYEERGRDLPAGYVRWTEQRNLQAFLDLIETGRLDPTPLTTHTFPVDEAATAYETLTGGGDRRPFGILLQYDEPRLEVETSAPSVLVGTPRRAAPGKVRIGLIGAGSFARGTLLPAFTAAGAELASVATGGGLSAADVGQRFGFERSVGSFEEILADDTIDAVVVATRHGEHARLSAEALRAGKAVFCEKPLALTAAELDEVEAALRDDSILMVGFNRRFAPLVERLTAEMGAVERRLLTVRVNAGALPHEHWLHDPEEGGGRLLGEGCHFVDLLAHLATAHAVSVHAYAAQRPDEAIETSDDVVAVLHFENGSVGTLAYTGSGDAKMPKERIEAFSGGLAATIDDFRRLELFRKGRQETVKSAQDKGHRAQIAAFVAAVGGSGPAAPVESYLASSRATLALVESLRTGLPVSLR